MCTIFEVNILLHKCGFHKFTQRVSKKSYEVGFYSVQVTATKN